MIDKDHSAALLAEGLDANGLVILTDGGGIFDHFGQADAREMRAVTPDYLREHAVGAAFPGSMLPKIEAAVRFVERSANPDAWVAIGDLRDALQVVQSAVGQARDARVCSVDEVASPGSESHTPSRHGASVHDVCDDPGATAGTIIRRGVPRGVQWWPSSHTN